MVSSGTPSNRLWTKSKAARSPPRRWTCQVFPPSVVARMAPISPTAQPRLSLRKKIPLRGRGCRVRTISQVAPRLGLCNRTEPGRPAAQMWCSRQWTAWKSQPARTSGGRPRSPKYQLSSGRVVSLLIRTRPPCPTATPNLSVRDMPQRPRPPRESTSLGTTFCSRNMASRFQAPPRAPFWASWNRALNQVLARGPARGTQLRPVSVVAKTPEGY